MATPSLRTSDFDYHLPQYLIAQEPVEPRDSSRLLVLNRDSDQIEHQHFRHLPEYLHPGDVLVFNDSRVVPARLFARRESTGGKVEFLLLQRLEAGVWRALGRPGRRLRPGTRFCMDGATETDLLIEVLEVGQDGVRTVRLSSEKAIERAGQIPLPPYIHTPLKDPERYQTVYSRVPGSVAAPTAGLHFTPELLQTLSAKGVRQIYITLHVGLDTFRPIKVEAPHKHTIHTEYFDLGQEAADEINAARREGRRIIAVGTTTVRVLEQMALTSQRNGSQELLPTAGWAELFILPGHSFKLLDAMITNFHLPRSTLLMLVSAFANRELILRAYQEAIAYNYRFYSFGDAMLIL